MRVPKYLSYSALSLWEKRPEEFYLRYICKNRAPRTPQEKPAAAGSAFDAIVKAALHTALFGVASDPKYTLEALFEAQVEPQNRDWAKSAGEYIFDCYLLSGFYSSLLSELQQSSTTPRFEFSVETTIFGVPVLCKPDAGWATPESVRVTHDWKVNGFCSKSAVSPHKSYQLCCDGYVGKQSRSHNTEHKGFLAQQLRDTTINTSYLEVSNPAWADQLSLYGWSMGEEIGDENIVLSVHQIVAKPIANKQPLLRVAQYRARVAPAYQFKLADRLRRCWNAVTSGYIFPEFSRSDSDARCEVLDATAIGLQSDGSNLEDYFNEVTREKYCG